MLVVTSGLTPLMAANWAAAQTASGTPSPTASEQAARPALGQPAVQAPGAPAIAPAVDSSSQLQEVVVTAQRRSERLQQVPIAVTAVTAAELVASGVTDTTRLNTVAPGLNLRSSFGSLLPSIRGVGTSSNVVENPVGFYVDGVYYPNQRDALRDLLDISQVAVLKGPQGTLFGRNSTAGVIQITTRAPTQDFHGDASAELDNYETGKATVYVTGGITDRLAGSLAAEYLTQGEGWGHDYGTGADSYKLEHQWALRGKLLFKPREGTEMTLILDYQDRLIRGSSYQPAPGTQFSYPGVGPLENQYDTYSGVNSQNAFRGGGVSLNIEQQLPFAKLVSITSYRRGVGQTRFDDSGVKTPYFIFDSSDNPNEDYTQEIQLVSPKAKFNWVTGVYYFHSSLATLPTTREFSGFLAPLPTSAFQTNTFGTEVAESVAPFAQADYEILPQTKLTFGARYTYEDRNFNGRLVANLKNGAMPVTTRTGDIRIYKTTVRAALDHQFTDNILGYLSYNTGIKSGGFNVLNITNPAYLPEELTAYEAGLKTEFFDKRARINLAGFYYDYNNIQVIQFTNGVQSIVNGAGAEVYGLDVDYAYEITRGLRVSGGFEVEHAEFTSFPGAVFSTPKPTGGATLFPATPRASACRCRRSSRARWRSTITGRPNKAISTPTSRPTTTASTSSSRTIA